MWFTNLMKMFSKGETDVKLSKGEISLKGYKNSINLKKK